MLKRIVNKSQLVLFISVFLSACSSMESVRYERVFLDSTFHKDVPPDWVKSTRVVWQEGDKVLIRSSHTVLGNERMSGCFDLAKLDGKEALLSEISSQLKGIIDSAETSLSENTEVVLGKMRSSEFSGTISGLRTTEQYFERYSIAEAERVDCHVLSEIRFADYQKMKSRAFDRVVAADPKIKEAIRDKQAEFFTANAGKENKTLADKK